jgi:hypothetical protein
MVSVVADAVTVSVFGAAVTVSVLVTVVVCAVVLVRFEAEAIVASVDVVRVGLGNRSVCVVVGCAAQLLLVALVVPVPAAPVRL